MKASEVRNLTTEDIRKQLNDNHQELFNLRFQIETRRLKNYQRIQDVRRDIARLHTVLRERGEA